MPRVLTVTQKPDESTEQFAARISGQLNTFFGEAEAPTDESAEQEVPVEEEPAPSA
jgi:hypothetical protein